MYFCNSSFFALASNAKIFAIDILVFSRLRVTHKVLQLLLQFFFFLLVASPGKLAKVILNFSPVANLYACDQSYLYDMPCAFEQCSLEIKSNGGLRWDIWNLSLQQLKTLYLHYHIAYGYCICQSGDLTWGAPTHKFTWPFTSLDYVVFQNHLAI